MTEPEQPTAHGPPLDRRTFVRTVGAGAGAVVAGTGATQTGLVGEAEGAVCGGLCIAGAAGVATGAGAVAAGYAGYKLRNWQAGSSDAKDGDANDVLKDEIYFHMVDIRNMIESDLKDLERYSQAASNNNYQNTPHGDSAWQVIRNAIVTAYQNGESQGTAIQQATQALQQQTAISYLNIIDLWNSLLESIGSELQLQSDNLNTDNYVIMGSDLSSGGGSDWINEDANHERYAGSDNIVESPVNVFDALPGDPADWDRVDTSDPTAYRMLGIALYDGDKKVAAPTAYQWPGGYSATPSINITNSPQDAFTLANVSTFDNATKCIKNAHEEIAADLNTFVDEMYSAFGDGAVDPANVVSPQDLIDQYADSSEQGRMTAELFAAGVPVPDDVGFQVRYSHDDINAQSVWGRVHPQFTGDPIDVSPNTTIAAADYNQAYAGFYDTNDEWQETILSGNSDLVIHDVAGLKDTQTLSAPDAAGANGQVTVYSGDSPPDVLANPSSNSGWTVRVVGETNTSNHPVADVDSSSGDYVLTSTSLTEGEAVEEIALVPPVSYTKPHEAEANPTNIDRDTLKAQVEAQKELATALEEWEASKSGGGGFLGGSGFLSGGSGVVGGAVVAVLAVLTLGQLSE